MALIDLHKFRQTFLGECKGVGLSPRGEEGGEEGDRHVMFTILTEDDGKWHAGGAGGAASSSSHWLPDLEQQLEAAHTWLERNADFGEYGWKFRS